MHPDPDAFTNWGQHDAAAAAAAAAAATTSAVAAPAADVPAGDHEHGAEEPGAVGRLWGGAVPPAAAGKDRQAGSAPADADADASATAAVLFLDGRVRDDAEGAAAAKRSNGINGGGNGPARRRGRSISGQLF